MNKKVLVSISVVLIYLVFFLTFIYYFNKSQECTYFSPCIRFCSTDKVEYSDEYLLEQFKDNKTGRHMFVLETNFKVLRGTPPCGEMNHWSLNEDGNFSKVPYRFDYVSIFNLFFI